MSFCNTAGATLLLLFALTGCGGPLSSAKSDFRSGRLAEAKDKLAALEAESGGFTGEKRAGYVLYRGLVSHALGDRDGAIGWLREAKAIEDAAPGSYSNDDRVRLELALDAASSGR